MLSIAPREPDFGAVNFLTGMGGFLQGVLHGYLGIRTGLDSLQLHPRLPRRSLGGGGEEGWWWWRW